MNTRIPIFWVVLSVLLFTVGVVAPVCAQDSDAKDSNGALVQTSESTSEADPEIKPPVPKSPDEYIEFGGDAPEAVPEEVTVEKIGDAEWKIFNRKERFVGTIKQEPDGRYKLFFPDGERNGWIAPSNDWYPRTASQKYTKIYKSEVQLYLDALDAIEKIEGESP